MATNLWAKAHGAATHFPLALTLCSGVLDTAGFVLSGRPAQSSLSSAGYWTILFAALGSVPAVASGLLMTKGTVLGHGVLCLHHLFVWPAFGLLIALAVWRAVIGSRATRPFVAGYLCCVWFAAILMLGAGYWGGELIMAH